jgi:hypothetical protein
MTCALVITATIAATTIGAAPARAIPPPCHATEGDNRWRVCWRFVSGHRHHLAGFAGRCGTRGLPLSVALVFSGPGRRRRVGGGCFVESGLQRWGHPHTGHRFSCRRFVRLPELPVVAIVATLARGAASRICCLVVALAGPSLHGRTAPRAWRGEFTWHGVLPIAISLA